MSFPTTAIALIDYGPGYGECFAESKPGMTPDDIYYCIKTAEYVGGDCIGVYLVTAGEVTEDITVAMAVRMRADLENGAQFDPRAVRFAERFAGYVAPKSRREWEYDEAEARAMDARAAKIAAE